MKNYRDFKNQILRNREVRRSYEALGPEFEVITLLIRGRLNKQLTQEELAQKIGTKQSAISRLESGTYNPSIAFLFKIADALNMKLKVSVSAK